MYTGMGDPLIVPVFGIVMIIAVVVGPIWIRSYYRSKEREQLHQTLRAAYEKGQPPPPELIEKLSASANGDTFPSSEAAGDRDLRRAIVLMAVGVGLAALGLGLGWGIGFASETGGAVVGGIIAGTGAIPGFIGVAYLILWSLGRKRQAT